MSRMIGRLTMAAALLGLAWCGSSSGETLADIVAKSEENRNLVEDYQASVVYRSLSFLDGVPDKPFARKTTKMKWLFGGELYRLERWHETDVDKALLEEKRPEMLKEMELEQRGPFPQTRHTIETYDGLATRLWVREKNEGLVEAGKVSPAAKERRFKHVWLSDLLHIGDAGTICSHTQARITGQERIGDDDVVVVEIPWARRTWTEKNYVTARAALLPNKAFIIRRVEFLDAAQRVASIYEATEVKQYGGAWLAAKAFRAHYRYAEDGARHLHYRVEGELESFGSKPAVSADDFHLVFPDGTRVVDGTTE